MRPSRFAVSALATAATLAMLAARLFAAPAAPPAQPAPPDKAPAHAPPSAPPAPAAPDHTPITDAEKPYLGRWTLDRAAAIPVIQKAMASKPKTAPVPAETLALYLEQNVGDLVFDLLPDHTLRVLSPTSFARGSWKLAGSTLQITEPRSNKTATLAGGVLSISAIIPQDDAPLPFNHTDFGPSPTPAQIIGLWKPDPAAVRAEAQKRYDDRQRLNPNAPGPGNKGDKGQAQIDYLVNQASTMAMFFGKDNAVLMYRSNIPNPAGAWSIEDDLVIIQGHGNLLALPFHADTLRMHIAAMTTPISRVSTDPTPPAARKPTGR